MTRVKKVKLWSVPKSEYIGQASGIERILRLTPSEKARQSQKLLGLSRKEVTRTR